MQKTNYKTEQETLWAGNFGDFYIDRNTMERLLGPKLVMWSRILSSMCKISTMRELGCNIGVNLSALHSLQPELRLFGHEINEKAVRQARKLSIAEITHGSIVEMIDMEPVDCVFTAGVLIHINPAHLKQVYRNIVYGTKRYVVLAEYYNPTPVKLPYRGQKNALFKRDFAGDLIEHFGLKLVDYGFVYHREHFAPQDDVHWFLLEK